MNSEEKIIKTFRRIYSKESLAELAKLTSIQKTRVFRILNGADLRWKEAEVLNQLIKKKIGDGYSDFFYDFVLGGDNRVNARTKSRREIEKRDLSCVYFLTEKEGK